TRILGLLDYGGDLLLRIDKLSIDSRFEQEAKVGDVSTRSFLRLLPAWLDVVKKGIG
ncbi:unnamed protein product, partial [marine sediment metagenome]